MIAIVDKAIFSNASGKEALGESLRNSVQAVVLRPITFLRSPVSSIRFYSPPRLPRRDTAWWVSPVQSFWWIWLVYGGTYTVANWVTVACERSSRPPDVPKFIASSTANVSLSLAKDRAFSRMYGVVKPKPVPATSLSLFAARDSLSILASFILPSKVAEALHERLGWSLGGADIFAQLTVPLAAQVVSTPMHLLGYVEGSARQTAQLLAIAFRPHLPCACSMDIYNRPLVDSAARAAFVAREYAKTTIARMARVLPAFGAGGVLNKSIRKAAHAVRARAYGLASPPMAVPGSTTTVV